MTTLGIFLFNSYFKIKVDIHKRNYHKVLIHLVIVGMWHSTHVNFNLVKNNYFWSKTTPKYYMVEKTLHIKAYFGPLITYLVPQRPRYGSKGVSIYQNDGWIVAVNS